MEEHKIVSVQEKMQLELLNNGLIMADKFINKNYLINLGEQEVVLLDKDEKDINYIRLFEILKLVYDKKECINDKLISVYSALQNINCSVLLLIDGEEDGVTFYIGVRSYENAAVSSKILEKSFLGNFPGSSLRNLKSSEIGLLMKSVVESRACNTNKNISCVTVIPSMRDKNKEKFVQGIEKFMDTMQGEKFTAVYIAKPVSKTSLESKKRGFEELYSSLSPFIKTSLAYGENFSKAVSKGMFENFSRSINQSVSNTTGGNSSKSISYSEGKNHGFSINGGGFGANSGTSSSTSTGYSSGQSWSKSVTEGTADTTGTGTSKSDTDTFGNTRTLTVEHQNKSVAVLLKKIDEQLERIKSCEAFGVWECAAYFIADDIQTSVVAANAYKALMIGDDTDVENSFVNIWGVKESENALSVLEYIKYGLHPLLKVTGETGYNKQIVTPGNLISGKELPLFIGLPHKSVSGLTVSSMAEFGRNVFVQNKNSDRKKVKIGNIYHMGNIEKNTVNLDLDSFTSHCFITGSTGSGKSNTTYCLLEKFIKNNIPFLVVEPAKGEYKDAFGGVNGINIFSTNPYIGRLLKLNPFRFEKNIHILEHLDRLIEIFNACWEMYAAMPAILKDAIERIYVEKGWDLLNSQYMLVGDPNYPTFNDLIKVLPKIINSSSYSSDTKGDYTGALVTRVKSLTNGIYGQIFCDNYDIPDNTLFDSNTIIDLSRVGSTETKALIMGLLVLKLSEYRMANATASNQGLKHITVLEEAHNLLKRTSSNNGGNTVVSKSVEMICNSIAEMRTYGEGFIIVDQSPTAVDIAAIKNTNTKILMRLPEKGDCEAVGNAVGLEDEQIRELSKLGTGVAVVMQNNWLEAVLTKVDVCSNEYEKVIKPIAFEEIRRLKGKVIEVFMNQYIQDRKLDNELMLEAIASVDASEYKKEEMRCWVNCTFERLKKSRDIYYFTESLINISGAKNIFQILERSFQKSRTGEYVYNKKNVNDFKGMIKVELKKYLDMPNAYLYTSIDYFFHSKKAEECQIDYGKIYDISRSKEGKS